MFYMANDACVAAAMSGSSQVLPYGASSVLGAAVYGILNHAVGFHEAPQHYWVPPDGMVPELQLSNWVSGLSYMGLDSTHFLCFLAGVCFFPMLELLLALRALLQSVIVAIHRLSYQLRTVQFVQRPSFLPRSS